MSFVKYRSTLDEWCDKRDRHDMMEYMTTNNSFSIDGLPSLALFRKDAPTTIEPFEEDGYVHGKVVINGGMNRRFKNKIQGIPAFMNRIVLRKIDLLLASVTVFALGLVTGFLLGKC
jgi:hypothetical protein